MSLLSLSEELDHTFPIQLMYDNNDSWWPVGLEVVMGTNILKHTCTIYHNTVNTTYFVFLT